jgi:choline dehydrogenase-like flavoprotein
VTDAGGRVHQTSNVYVVDASTFPTIGATNPHTTIAALARMQSLKMEV